MATEKIFFGYKNKILNGDSMKVVELIKELEKLGYNEETKICFGFYDYGGDWIDFQVEEVEDGDREVDVDTIGVILRPNKEYEDLIMQEVNADLKEELLVLIRKYC